MMSFKQFCAALVIVSAASLSQAGAASLADIKAQVDAAASELDEVDALLADPDPNKRLAAINMLLASDDATWVKRAKDVGLFSDDVEMQRAVVHAVFETGGPFRADIKLADEKKTAIRAWIKNHSGTVDEKLGLAQVVILLRPYSAEEKCWQFDGSSNCAFYPTGEFYSLNDWHDATGSVRLDANGALVGSFTARNGDEAVAIRIPLAD